MRKGRAVLTGVLGILVWVALAEAHMMPAQQGSLNVLGSSVFEVVAVPASALSGIDDDGDGRLSAREAVRHQAEIKTQVGARFRLYDGDRSAFWGLARQRPAPTDNPGVQEVVLIRAEHDERAEGSEAGAKQLLVLLKTTFPRPPGSLRLETDLFGTASGEGQLTIRATRGGEQAEVAMLRPLAPEHCFFRPPARLFADFFGLGIEHILLGADHLLFVLTVLVAAAGWRYWLAVLTSFTVAHCLTLTLAVFGIARVSGRIVEPLIAASIVLMATLNLRRTQTSPERRVAVVFACGLLHGLGFASAMMAMGVSPGRRVVTLLGFNLGIEVGQALFLVALLAITHAVIPRTSLVKYASVVAIALGSRWFIQRILFAAS